MKVKTTYKGCPYITAGKEYEADDLGCQWRIKDDQGDWIHPSKDGTNHLNGRSFEIVNEDSEIIEITID